ncbi:uncharacterized protein E0L32_009805 [Thyridium curvatum]|uniref:Uncharacterized protein n=1 Tax=Thyridium curvatum TaxID=1093900 RepID=A0A507AM80_9PEZI|nr:uncharacterized protein E0L32_009805 [Thyridium curvatum]TPX08743.1 hypothetical protein E0L32_009805 [Thyridium curvatum]
MPTPTPGSRSRRDSWPPTQVHIGSTMDHDNINKDEPDLALIDDDPLTYFLTPAPAMEDEDMMDLDMDAGIEDPKNQTEIVRSVSPSSLGGLSRPPPRPPTPPRSPPCRLSPDPDSTTDDDDDGEEYIRLGTSYRLPLNLPFSLREFTGLRKKASAGKTSRPTLLSPNSFPGPGSSSSSSMPPSNSYASSRGRSAVRFGSGPPGSRRSVGLRERTQSLPTRQSPRAWREPSPDVWSIEEEAEDDVEMGTAEGGTQAATEAPVTKPKKRVRFVLPVQEI